MLGMLFYDLAEYVKQNKTNSNKTPFSISSVYLTCA